LDFIKFNEDDEEEEDLAPLKACSIVPGSSSTKKIFIVLACDSIKDVLTMLDRSDRERTDVPNREKIKMSSEWGIAWPLGRGGRITESENIISS